MSESGTGAVPNLAGEAAGTSRRLFLSSVPLIALGACTSASHTTGGTSSPPRPKILAYLSGAAATQGKAAFRQHASLIDEVALSWWRPADAADGTLSLQDPGLTKEDSAFVADVQHQGSAAWGVTANYHGHGQWRWDIVSRILNSTTGRAAHVRSLVELAVARNYVGFDVDYEKATRRADGEVFSRFCHELAEAMHQSGKKLSITVHPKLSQPGSEPRQSVQDWATIGAVADEVHIMLYDYAPASGPASQSPLPWWKAQAKFAVTLMPANKILLGAPSYGYLWKGTGRAAKDLEWRSIERLRRKPGTSRVRDPDTHSVHLTYDMGGLPHHVWYEDARALAERAQVVRKYGMGGLFLWRLGGEDPALWRAVRSELDGRPQRSQRR